MKVLFLSNEYGVYRSGSAYAHRLQKLRCGVQQPGIQTKFLSLREQPDPCLILAHRLNLPFIRKKIADCDFINNVVKVVCGLTFTRATAKDAARMLEEV